MKPVQWRAIKEREPSDARHLSWGSGDVTTASSGLLRFLAGDMRGFLGPLENAGSSIEPENFDKSHTMDFESPKIILSSPTSVALPNNHSDHYTENNLNEDQLNSRLENPNDVWATVENFFEQPFVENNKEERLVQDHAPSSASDAEESEEEAKLPRAYAQKNHKYIFSLQMRKTLKNYLEALKKMEVDQDFRAKFANRKFSKRSYKKPIPLSLVVWQMCQEQNPYKFSLPQLRVAINSPLFKDLKWELYLKKGQISNSPERDIDSKPTIKRRRKNG